MQAVPLDILLDIATENGSWGDFYNFALACKATGRLVLWPQYHNRASERIHSIQIKQLVSMSPPVTQPNLDWCLPHVTRELRLDLLMGDPYFHGIVQDAIDRATLVRDISLGISPYAIWMEPRANPPGCVSIRWNKQLVDGQSDIIHIKTLYGLSTGVCCLKYSEITVWLGLKKVSLSTQ